MKVLRGSTHSRYLIRSTILLLLQLASEGIKREYTQSLFDQANYEDEEKDGEDLVRQVKESLGDYFSKKKRAAQVTNQYVLR